MATDLEIIKELEEEIGHKIGAADNTEDWYIDTSYIADPNRNVVGISLKGLNLRKFPLTILKLKKLNLLHLWGNAISTLPPEIIELNLSGLNLEKNALEELPIEVTELKSLSNLCIAQNELSTLPPELANLKEIRRLLLYSNEFTILPSVICQLPNLRELVLYSNQLGARQFVLLPSLSRDPKGFKNPLGLLLAHSWAIYLYKLSCALTSSPHSPVNSFNSRI